MKEYMDIHLREINTAEWKKFKAIQDQQGKSAVQRIREFITEENARHDAGER